MKLDKQQFSRAASAALIDNKSFKMLPPTISRSSQPATSAIFYSSVVDMKNRTKAYWLYTLLPILIF
ncbi:hypothetical protein T11_11757 [Trichinella zimbabwensis]|uniref:Uncharacterized protein n=2 Tax=Trichinella TaxID=6333 RepID=A0A0V1N2Y9_9BILA|nr:hypothetical protein T11_11757 [Trichinella zimbabwensis]KRZ78349.1 hypothetical protein T10_7991 [Trichinella papuae]